jgi:hypothetical protein
MIAGYNIVNVFLKHFGSGASGIDLIMVSLIFGSTTRANILLI